jgi:hypothetical protein
MVITPGCGGGGSADGAFQRHRQQGLGLERELHRQLVEHRLAEAADDQRRGLLRAMPRCWQ